MLVLTAPMQSIADTNTHKWAVCWEIIRKDGAAYRFTSHEKRLVVNGNTYTPVEGIDVAAVRQSDSLRGHNTEATGVISSTSIKHADLKAGKFRGAVVNEYHVNWDYPWAGILRKYRYFVLSTKFNGNVWVAELGTLAQWLQQPVGTLLTRDCGFNFGGPGCNLNLGPFTLNGCVVTEIVKPRNIFKASDGGFGTKLADAYRYGNLQWTTGLNDGEATEVSASSAPTGNVITFTLFQSSHFEIAVNDTFSATLGCAHSRDACKSFGNMVRFGGFEFIPGADKSLATPE